MTLVSQLQQLYDQLAPLPDTLGVPTYWNVALDDMAGNLALILPRPRPETQSISAYELMSFNQAGLKVEDSDIWLSGISRVHYTETQLSRGFYWLRCTLDTLGNPIPSTGQRCKCIHLDRTQMLYFRVLLKLPNKM